MVKKYDKKQLKYPRKQKKIIDFWAVIYASFKNGLRYCNLVFTTGILTFFCI